MNNEETWVQMTIQSIPTEVMNEVKTLKICEAGFAAGPGYVTGQIQDYPEPVSMNEALTYLSKYVNTFKASHLKFENGKRIYIRHNGFYKYV